MIVVVLAMLAILLLSGLLFAFVAFPHLGRDIPLAARLDAVLRGVVARLPTWHNTADSHRPR